MRDNKAVASLTSGLLARKGQARPAMRPQGFGLGQGNPDDLGWNDMGYDAPRIAGARLPANLSGPQAVLPAQAEPPEVVRQQDEIAREFAAPEPIAEPVADELVAIAEPVVIEVALPEIVIEAPVIAEPARVAAPSPKVAKRAARVRAKPVAARTAPAPRAVGRKAAFTLRLDAERHLRLRLACAVQNRSAQMLVTDALDRLLASLPDVERLAASLPDPDRHD